MNLHRHTKMKPLISSDLHARSERNQSKLKLMFFGDPHGDLDSVIAAVEHFRPEAIVLLGDIQARRPLHIELAPILGLTEVWFIHGNHDTDTVEDFDNLFGSQIATRNLHGRIVEIAGFKVAGLGGIFRSKIWDPRRPIEEAVFQSSDAMRRTMKRGERWRDGISRKHPVLHLPGRLPTTAQAPICRHSGDARGGRRLTHTAGRRSTNSPKSLASNWWSMATTIRTSTISARA
jgi:hypothetical protein